MRNGTNVGIIVGTFAAIFAFWILWFTVPTDVTFELINGLIIASAFGAWVAFTPGLISVLREERRPFSGGDLLTISIWIACVGLIMLFTDLWIYRVTEQVIYRDHWIGAWGRWILVISAVLTVAASGEQNNMVPPVAYAKAGLLSMSAAAVVVLLVFFGYSAN